jgi:hypothetical protein
MMSSCRPAAAHHLMRPASVAPACSAHRHRQQPLADIGDNLPDRHRRRLRHTQRPRGSIDPLVVLFHSGPLLDGVSGKTPNTYRTAGVRRGTATSNSTKSGATSPAAADSTPAQSFRPFPDLIWATASLHGPEPSVPHHGPCLSDCMVKVRDGAATHRAWPVAWAHPQPLALYTQGRRPRAAKPASPAWT